MCDPNQYIHVVLRVDISTCPSDYIAPQQDYGVQGGHDHMLLVLLDSQEQKISPRGRVMSR
jgi:hypothetical protein